MAVDSQKQIILFTGVMDGDTEKRRIQEGNYIKLLNGRNGISNGQNNGAVEDAEGNLLINNPYFLFGGTYKCVGTFEDIKGDSIIYLVYNSEGYHGIFRWHANRAGYFYGVIEKIFQVTRPQDYNQLNPNPLNFQADELITGINLIDDYLYWSSGSNESKEINIVTGNENKTRSYNFYINQAALGETVDYELTQFDNLFNLIGTATFQSFEPVLQERVADLTQQINNNLVVKLTAINRSNYIELVCLEEGEYTITLDDSGSLPSRLVAKNFYYLPVAPILGVGNILRPVPSNFFNLIKYPPFCSPISKYIPAGDLQQNGLRGDISGGVPPLIGSGTFGPRVWALGFGSEVNDVLNNIKLGPTVLLGYVGPFLYYLSPFDPIYPKLLSWMVFDNTVTMDVEVVLNITAAHSGSSISIRLFKVDSGNNHTDLGLIGLFVWTANQNVFPFQRKFTKTITFTSNPSEKVYVEIIASNIPFSGQPTFSVVSGFAQIGDLVVDAGDNLQQQSVMIRGKYQFENYQNSVYGQATSIILRTENYYNQYTIENLFDDKFLQNDTYISRIRRIIMSYSPDNGTTWFDYEELEPYQFACEGSRVSIFDNKKFVAPVSNSEAATQFHAVPLWSKSQEYIDERLWLGGINEGYDTIDVDFELSPTFIDLQSNIAYSGGAVPISRQGFKPGHRGYIGIVYYDDFDRKSPVCIGENSLFEIPYYPNPRVSPVTQSLATSAIVWGLNIEVYNEPPPWATKYQIVRTNDLSQTSYLIWTIDSVNIIQTDGSIGLVSPKYYEIVFDNIPYYVEKTNRGAVIEYAFERGDRVRLIAGAGGLLNDPFTDLKIEVAEGNSIYVTYDPSLNLIPGDVLELYSKSDGSLDQEGLSDDVYYEMGKCYEVATGIFNGITRKYHTGNRPAATNANQSYQLSITTPALLQTFAGSAYYRIRTMYSNTAANPLNGVDLWIPSSSSDEYELSKFDGLTRPNVVLEIGNLDRVTTLRFSNNYVSGTQLNGLNAFEGLNEKQYNTNYGLMCKMQVVDNDVLKLIFENSYQLSVYVNQGIITQSQGNSPLIAVSEEVAGNSHIIQRTLGSINPESITVNDEGDMMGYDEIEGVVWRASGNGLIQLSDSLQKTNFKNWSADRNMFKRKGRFTPAVYDIYHDEYLLTLGSLAPSRGVFPTVCDIFFYGIFFPIDSQLVYNITIFIEETGEVILAPLDVFASGQINNEIYNAFTFAGWGATYQADGTLCITAPNLFYSEQNIVIQITDYTVTPNGDNLIQNGGFVSPVSEWYEYVDSGPTPKWSFDAITNQAIHASGANYPLIQFNLGLTVGKIYQVTFDVEVSVGSITPILGYGANQSSGTTVLVTQLGVTQNITYFDDTREFPVIYLVPPPKINSLILDDLIQFLPSTDFVGSISNVSVKPVLGAPRNVHTHKYTLSAGSNGEALLPFEGLTIAYNKQKHGFPEQYSFVPEIYGRLRDKIVSFVDGKFWLHHVDAVPKNYYGVQYARELTFICNRDFNKVKQFKAVVIDGLGLNSAPEITIPPYEGVPSGMLTELTQAHFRVAEGLQYGAIQRDKNTPGAASPDDGWINGREMKGKVLEVNIVNNDPVVTVVYSTEILYFYSENS